MLAFISSSQLHNLKISHCRNLYIYLNFVEERLNKFTKEKKLNDVMLIFVKMARFLKIPFITFAFLILSMMASCRSRGPYNPYLHKKEKPNKIQMDEDKKTIKKGNKAYKKQLGNNRKHLFGRRKAPGA